MTGRETSPAKTDACSDWLSTNLLVQREAELGVVQDALASARAGRGAVSVIRAQAGHGKTRLLAAAHDVARTSGMTVLRAQASELERDFPFGVALQLIEPLWMAADEEQRASWIAGPAGAATQLLQGSHDAVAAAHDKVPFALIHGLFALLRDVAARNGGIAVLVDDAHWADGHSWRFLAYLGERIGALPVTIVLSARVGAEVAEPRALSALQTLAGPHVLTLDALTDAGVAALVRARLPQSTGAFIARCIELTSGNPFLLSKLIDQVAAERLAPDAATGQRLVEHTPDAVVNSVLGRLDELPAEVMHVARSLAVMGDEAPLRDIAHMADLSEAAAAAAADALAANHLLRPGFPLAFAHPLIKSAVRASLAPLERARLHRRAAAILLDQGAVPDQVAAQLLHAPAQGDARAVDALVAAARQAMSAGVPDHAVRLLARAREEIRQPASEPELLAQLAEAEAAAGAAGAAERLQEAIAVNPSPARRDCLRLALVNAHLGCGRADLAATIVTDELEQVPEPGTPAQDSDFALLSTARMVPELRDRALVRGTELASLISSDPSPLERRVLAEVAATAALAGRDAHFVRFTAERAWGDGTLLDIGAPYDWRAVSQALFISDDLERDIQVCEAVLSRGRHTDGTEIAPAARSCRAWARYEQGAIADAIVDARAALDWTAPADGRRPIRLRSSYAVLALCLIDADQLDQAETALSILDHPGTRESVHYAPLLEVRARLRLAQRRPADALADATEAGHVCEQRGLVNPGVVPWRATRALALIALGAHEEALAAAQEELEIARSLGLDRIAARALRCAGLAARGERRIALLTEAVTLCRELPPRRELIEALLAWGAGLRRSNRRAAAREPLREALQLAQAGGAWRLAAEAQDELTATGARARRMLEGGLASLTPREHAVAQLAGTGQTTRSMAEALFVTPKTIEYHLRQIYRKLDISSRAELAEMLARSAAE